MPIEVVQLRATGMKLTADEVTRSLKRRVIGAT